MTDALFNQLGDVDQPFNRPLNPGEGAEGDELRDEPCHYLSLRILIDDSVPLRGVSPPHAERDLLVLCVNLGHVDIDFVSHLEEV